MQSNLNPCLNVKLLTLSVSVIGSLMVSQLSHAKQNQQTIKLSDTVVTATRLETPLKDVVGDVTVIDEDELKLHQGDSLFEVLKSQPGIQVKSYGGFGQASNVFIRGNNQAHSMVLVDGVPIGSATSGTPSLQNISADQISRVEVLYGSSATSLYGSGAIGGVIQIFTKANSGKNYSAISVAGGTENTYTANASTNGKIGKTQYGLNVSATHTDGISATKSYVPYGSFEDDKDPHEKLSVNASVSHQLSEATKLGLAHTFSQSNTDYDEGAKDQHTNNDGEANITSLWLQHKQDNLNVKSQLGISTDNNKYDGNYGKSRFDTKQTILKTDLGYDVAVGSLTAGYERLIEEVTSSVAYPTKKRATDSFLAGYLLAEDSYQAQINVRHDKNLNLDSVTTYSIGAAFLPTDGVRLGTSYATGYNQPTFNALYYPKYGNPDLKPEKSKNVEGFFELFNSNFTSRVTVYNNRVTDLISGSKNINKAELLGVTVKTDYKKGNFSSGLHYDYLDAQDKSAGKELPYRAEQSAGAYIGYNQGKLTLRTELDYVGDRRADYSDAKYKPVSSTLKAYTLANVYANYAITPYLDVNVKLNNILDEDYETSYGYQNLGINGMLGVKLHTY